MEGRLANLFRRLASFCQPLFVIYKAHKTLIVNGLKYGVALGLLSWVIWKNWKADANDGLAHIWNMHVVDGQPMPHPEFFALAMFLCLASVLLTFVRWYVLVRAVDLPFRVSDALRLGMVGYFFNAFLPGSVGGDLLKAAFLAREHQRRTVAVATVIMDRMFSLWALIWFVAILGCGFWLNGVLESDTAVETKQIIIGAVAICVTSLFVWFPMGLLSNEGAERVADKLNRLPKIGHSAAEFWRAIWMYRCRQWSVYLVMFMAFVGFFGFVLAFYFSVQTLAAPTERIPTLQEHFLVIPVGLVIQALPGLPGGLGLGEWGFGAMYDRMHCASSLGVLGSLVYRVISWTLGLSGYLVYLRMKPRLVRAENEAEMSAAEATEPHAHSAEAEVGSRGERGGIVGRRGLATGPHADSAALS